MRVLLVIFFVSILGSNDTFSQVFKSGAILGINTAQIEGDGHAGYKKPGLIIGGFTNTKLSENWSAQFEITYINKGSRKNANPSEGDFNSLKVTLDYIEIPVTLRYHYKKFMFETGLFYGVLLNSKVENEFGEVAIQRFPFKNYDFGGFLGLYYQLNDHFILNFRSKNSLLPVRNFQNLDQSIGIYNRLFSQGWYNVELSFSVRYQFGE